MNHTARSPISLRGVRARTWLWAPLFLMALWVVVSRGSSPVAQAAAQAQVAVRVTIERVRELDCLEGGVFGSCLGKPDFYAVVNIDGQEFINKADAIDDDDDISPNWQFFLNVDAARTSVPVVLSIFDEDGFLRGDDDHVDIDPRSGRNLELTVNLAPCSVEDDVVGSCGTTLVSAGAEGDRGEVRFRIDVGPIVPVTARVTIERVRELDCLEGTIPIIGGCAGDPDFYAVVHIDGQEFDNKPNAIDDDDDIFPNWEFSKVVDFDKGTIPVTIDIFDEDGFLRGDDDHVDLKPTPGRTLNLTLNLSACTAPSGAGGVTGDVSGSCGATLISSGTESDRAEIWFRVQVERPPSVPGLRVLCLHDPIWPQATDTVTFTATALDGSLNNKIVDEIEVWVNSQAGPVQTCTGGVNCSASRGPFISGSSIFYGCVVRDGTDEIWSGWHTVNVGLPSSGRAVPVLFTGPRDSRIDLVFIADRDSYSGPTDADFLDDVDDVIRNAYYAEDVYLSNQDKVNFWVALDTADAEPDCEHSLPSNWDSGYSFADAGAILHTDSFRDCAPGGERIFSTEPTSFRTVVHETGHRPFGLADEYCCDGGYYQNEPYPNVYEEPSDCIADIPNLQIWDDRLGHTRRTTSDCREFTEPIDWWFDSDWSISDPSADDLMVDNGTPRGADVRRITWLFDRCAAADCQASAVSNTDSRDGPATTAGGPGTDPIPVFDFGIPAKAMIVRLNFNGREQVGLGSAEVISGRVPVLAGNPPLLNVQVRGEAGNLMEIFNAWHPLWAFVSDSTGERRDILPSAGGQFVFPFSPYHKTMEVSDVPLQETLITVDLEPAINDFCRENPADPECIADLAITKSDAPDPALAGENLVYTIRVTNHGPVSANGVTVTDQLPGATTLVSATPSQGSCAGAGSVVTCNLGELLDDAVAVIAVTVRVNPDPVHPAGCPPTFTNRATVTSPQGHDPDLTNNVVVIPTTILLDDFNRPNGQLGASWSGRTDIRDYQIAGQQLDVETGGDIYWNPTGFGANQEACFTLTKVDPAGYHHSLMLKVQGASWRQGAISVYYRATTGKIGIETYVPGRGWETLASVDAVLHDGDRLLARALADGTVRAYVNGGLVAEANAGSFFVNKGGRVGLWFIVAANSMLDDFAGGTIGSAGPGGLTPLVAVREPASGTVISVGEPVVLSGVALDAEDGPLGGTSLVWRSDRDGQLGTGQSLSLDALSPGPHLLTLAATDSDGNVATAAVNITVEEPQGPDPNALIPWPADLHVERGADSAALSWKPVTARGYKVYYSDRPGPPYNGTGLRQGDSPIDAGSATQINLTGVGDRVLHFAVTAYDTVGRESWYSVEIKGLWKVYLPVAMKGQ